MAARNADVPTYVPQEGVRPTRIVQPYGTEALGRAAEVVGEGFSRISDQLLRQHARSVERKSIQAGTLYGSTEKPQSLVLPQGDSVADEAFRRAAVASARSQVVIDLSSRAREIVAKYPTDPTGLGEAMDVFAEEYTAELDPALYADSMEVFNSVKLDAIDDAYSNLKKVTVDKSRATMMEAENSLFNQIVNGAYAGKDVAPLLDELDRLYQRHGPLDGGGDGGFDYEEIAGRKEKIAGKARAASVEGRFNVQGSLGGKQQFLDTFEANLDKQGMDYNDAQQLARWMRQEVNVLKAEAKAESAVRMQELRMDVENATQVLQSGGQLDPVQLDDVRRRARGTKLESRLNTAMALSADTKAFAIMSPGEQAATLRELEGKTSTLETADLDIGKRRAFGAIYNDTLNAIRAGRTLDRYAELGIEQIQPVNFTDPASWKGRVRVARKAGEHFGGAPSMALREDESAVFGSMWNSWSPQQQGVWLASMREQLSPDEFAYVQKEMGRSKIDPSAMLAADKLRSHPASIVSVTEILTANKLDWETIPLEVEQKKRINKEVTESFHASDVGQVFQTAAGLMGGTMADQYAKTMAYHLESYRKLAGAKALGGSQDPTGEAFKTIYDDVQTYNEPGEAVVFLRNPNVDLSQVTQGLATIRQSIGDKLAWRRPEFGSEELFQEYVSDIVEGTANASWINANDDSFWLSDGAGHLIETAPGVPLRVTLQEALNANAVP